MQVARMLLKARLTQSRTRTKALHRAASASLPCNAHWGQMGLRLACSVLHISGKILVQVSLGDSPGAAATASATAAAPPATP